MAQDVMDKNPPVVRSDHFYIDEEIDKAVEGYYVAPLAWVKRHREIKKTSIPENYILAITNYQFFVVFTLGNSEAP